MLYKRNPQLNQHGELVHLLSVEGLPKSIPVSYTHLRAHETVLDLVCRLLLEKTKNDNTPDRIHVTTQQTDSIN